jgi:hypothetical protein
MLVISKEEKAIKLSRPDFGEEINITEEELIDLESFLKSYKPTDKKAQYEKEFEELVWPIAYKKSGKETAKKAYLKIRKEVARTDEQRENVLEAWRYVNEVVFPAQHKEKGTKQFIPLPSSWINQQRWNDEDVQQGLHQRFVTGESAPPVTTVSKADQREYDRMVQLQSFYTKYQGVA